MDLPQTYAKDGVTRTVTTPAELVKAKFEGFRPAGEVVNTGPDYDDLREQAAAKGIPLNQSRSKLVEALVAPETDPKDPKPADEQNDPQDPAPAKRVELDQEPAPAKPVAPAAPKPAKPSSK